MIKARLVTGDIRELAWYPNNEDGGLLEIDYHHAKLAMRGRGMFALTVFDTEDREIAGTHIVEIWEEEYIPELPEIDEAE